MTVAELMRRGRLWNHTAVRISVKMWLAENQHDWCSVSPSQMRLLYRQLQPCETLVGLVKKLMEFETELAKKSSAGGNRWLRPGVNGNLLARLRSLLETSASTALSGNGAGVKLGNQYLADPGEKLVREMQIAREVLDWLLMQYKSREKEKLDPPKQEEREPTA